MNDKIIMDNIAGGFGEDDDMTDRITDLDYTKNKLIRIAKENNMTEPYCISILPKKWEKEGTVKYLMGKMILIDKSFKVLRTNNLTWDIYDLRWNEICTINPSWLYK